MNSRCATLCPFLASVAVFVAACLVSQLVSADAITWATDSSGSWHDAVNWSSDPALPGAGDTVTIDRGGADPVVTHSSGFTTIGGLTSNESLELTGGSLTVTGASILNGPLSVSGNATLSASGASLSASGTTTVNHASLTADGGGTVSMPMLNSFAGSNSNYSYLKAIGTGSALNLGSMTSLTSDSFWATKVMASAGGSIDLSSLPAINSLTTQITADGTDSEIDLSMLASFGAFNGILNATNGGTIVTDNLTSLSGVAVYLDSTSTISTSQFSTLNGNSSITAVGASPDLTGLTNIDHSSLVANNGAALTTPSAVTSFAGSNTAYSHLQANGSGSQLNLGSVTSLTSDTFWATMVTASAGGSIDLSALSMINAGNTRFNANGANSEIDLSMLTNFNAFIGGIVASDGGTILLPASTTVSGVSVVHTSTGTIDVGTLELGAASALSGDGNFAADVVNTAGTVYPGQSALGIDGDYTQDEEGHVVISLAPLATAGQQDTLEVSGAADLDGYLDLTLGSFQPTLGETIVVVSADSVTGTFPGVTDSDAGNGVSLAPDVVGDEVVLRGVFTSDSNNDGHIDGLDYLIWAGNFGSFRANHNTGDNTGDATVDGLDYLVWAGNYGQGPNDVVAVPEPVSLALLVFGHSTMTIRRRRNRSR